MRLEGSSALRCDRRDDGLHQQIIGSTWTLAKREYTTRPVTLSSREPVLGLRSSHGRGAFCKPLTSARAPTTDASSSLCPPGRSCLARPPWRYRSHRRCEPRPRTWAPTAPLRSGPRRTGRRFHLCGESHVMQRPWARGARSVRRGSCRAPSRCAPCVHHEPRH